MAWQVQRTGGHMRRLAIIGTLLVGLVTGLGLTGIPAGAATAAGTGAQAAARARVKVVVTSLSGRRILVFEGRVRCNTTRRFDWRVCDWEVEHFTKARHSHTIRVKRTHSAGFNFWSEHRFRMHVYVNGVERHNRKAKWNDYWNDWERGFFFFGPGAIELL